MKKKVIAILLSAFYFITSLPVQVFADPERVGTYVLNGETKIVYHEPGTYKYYYYPDINDLNNITDIDPDIITFDAGVSKESDVSVSYLQSTYNSTVTLAINSGFPLEQIELQLLRFLATDLSTTADLFSAVPSVQNDMSDLRSAIQANNTTSKSIFRTDNTDNWYLEPLSVLADNKAPEGSVTTTTSEWFREALVIKVDKVMQSLDSYKDNKNMLYTTVNYCLNTLQALNEFNYSDSSELSEANGNKIEDLLSSKPYEGKTLWELKAELEKEGAKNNLTSITTDIFEEMESSFKATRLYQAFLKDLSGQGDYYYTKELLMGKALSSAYVPLRTNVYKNPYLDVPDEADTFKSFNATYGGLRKALLMANSNKAVAQSFLTGQQSSYYPATLRDLLDNPDDEKILVVDPGYYNADKLADHDWSDDHRLQVTLGSDEVVDPEAEGEPTGEDTDDTDSEEETEETTAYDPAGAIGKDGSKDDTFKYEVDQNNTDGIVKVNPQEWYFPGTKIVKGDSTNFANDAWTIEGNGVSAKNGSDTKDLEDLCGSDTWYVYQWPTTANASDNRNVFLSTTGTGHPKSANLIQQHSNKTLVVGLGTVDGADVFIKIYAVKGLWYIADKNENLSYCVQESDLTGDNVLTYGGVSFELKMTKANTDIMDGKTNYFEAVKTDEEESTTETTTEATIDVDDNGATNVAGRSLYKDLVEPVDVYADLASIPALNGSKFKVLDLSSRVMRDAIKNYAYGESNNVSSDSAGKLRDGVYPEGRLELGISNSVAFNNKNDLIDTSKISDVIAFAAGKAGKSTVSSVYTEDDARAYIYHWLGYALVLDGTFTQDINANEMFTVPNLKKALEYHLTKVNNPNGTFYYGKLGAFMSELALIVQVTSKTDANNASINMAGAIYALRNEGVIPNDTMADYMNAYFNYYIYKMRGASHVTNGASDIGNWFSGNYTNQAAILNMMDSIAFYDYNNLAWIFAESNELQVAKSVDWLDQIDIKIKLRTAVKNQTKDLGATFDAHKTDFQQTLTDMSEGGVAYWLLHPGTTLRALENLGSDTATSLTMYMNVVRLVITGSTINNHPGYTKLSESDKKLLLDCLSDDTKSMIDTLLECQEFLEGLFSTDSDAFTMLSKLFEGNLGDAYNSLLDKLKTDRENSAMQTDSTSNESSDLFQSNGEAAKLTQDELNSLEIDPAAIKEVWSAWYNKPNHFTAGINTKEQATLLGSALLRQDIAYNVEANLNTSHNNLNYWYGIAFGLDVINHASLADAVVGFENKPVFRSAPTIIDDSYQDALFNNMLLNNIIADYPIRWDAVLDMDSPIFIDIYGNIVTESGLVVIPFAANSTLHKKINLLNSTFLHSYGKSMYFKYELNETNDTDMAFINDKYYFSLSSSKAMNNLKDYPAFFEVSDDDNNRILIPDEDSGTWIINPIILNTDAGSVSLNKIETIDIDVARVLYTLAMSAYQDGISAESTENAFINIKSDISNILYQVCRGANIEDIDYSIENLMVGNNYNQTVLSQASKYEDLVDQLSSLTDNTLISVPDITTLSGVEYLIFFLYKVILVVFVFYLLVQIYLATASQTFGVTTIGKIVIAFICTVTTIFAQPYIYKFSYYYTNRAILQDEAEIITMLNREKYLNNVELGVLKARNAEQNSRIMLKVTTIDVDTFDFLSHIVDATTAGSINRYYDLFINRDIETSVEEYEQRGASLYYDVADLFDSSVITVNTSNSQLLNVTTGNPAIAFRSPYYAILDYLIRQVNSYNTLIGSYDYGTINTGDGSIRTIGLSERYFNSNAFNIGKSEFFELWEKGELPSGISEEVQTFGSTYDRSGIYAIYGQDNRNIWDSDAQAAMQRSAWYADAVLESDMSDQEVKALSDYMDNEAIDWVNRHREILGRISDETILKSLALHLSLEYNKYLGVDGPQYYEIDTISTDDLLRVCLASRGDVMSGSVFTYPKFILNNSGLPGVYLGAILTMITFVLSLVKPLATIITFLILIFSLIIFRLLLNQKTEALKGVIKYAILMTVLNVSYGGVLWILVNLPIGIPTFVRIIVMIMLHFFFTGAYIWIVCVLIFNWKDFGNTAFTNMIRMRSFNIKEISTETINTEEREGVGRSLYEKLKSSDKWRHRKQ